MNICWVTYSVLSHIHFWLIFLPFVEKVHTCPQAISDPPRDCFHFENSMRFNRCFFIPILNWCGCGLPGLFCAHRWNCPAPRTTSEFIWFCPSSYEGSACSWSRSCCSSCKLPLKSLYLDLFWCVICSSLKVDLWWYTIIIFSCFPNSASGNLIYMEV